MAPSSLSKLETEAVRAYVDALEQRYGGQLVDAFLFGSKARGESHADSDIDVLVILEHATTDDLSEARGLAFDIWLTYEVFLSIRAMSHEQWQALAALQSLFYRNALHDAIPLLPMAV